MGESRGLRLGLGADHVGSDLKNALKVALGTLPEVSSVRDFGVADSRTEVAYPVVALEVAEAVSRGELDRAILVCGTGIGMAICANKVRGVRAAVAADFHSVERSVLSNNCQVLAFGADVIAPKLAVKLAEYWLAFEFDETTPSGKKMAVLTDYEEDQACRRA